MTTNSKDTKSLGRQFVRWAKKATEGIDNSKCMVGIITGDQKTKLEFALQVGHCLIEGKPLYLVVPMNHKLPYALFKAAAAIEFFNPDDEGSFRAAVQRVMERSKTDETSRY